jgi:hypothetical protein
VAADGPSGPLPFLGGLARSERRQDRRLWLRVATDLVLRGDAPDFDLSDAFLSDFADCLTACDGAEQLSVAGRLLTGAPVSSRLLELFLDLGGEAASFVLAHANGLSRDILLAAASDPVGARAIARRDDLDEDLVATILASEDLETLAALAGNRLAPLSGSQLRALAARTRDRIAEPAAVALADNLLGRETPRAELAALFLYASRARRTAILLAAQRNELGRPRAVAPTLAAGREELERLERQALDGETADFTSTLATILNCPPDLARSICEDRDGEPLAVTLAALGAPDDVSVRILTAADLRDGADYPRVGALARLRDALNPNAARVVLEAMIGHALPLATPVPTPSATSTDRRARPATMAQAAPLANEGVAPAVLRRRKAFAFAAQAERKP